MFCHKCGTQQLNDAEFCHKCGAKLIIDETEKPESYTPVTNNAPVIPNSVDSKVFKSTTVTEMNTDSSNTIDSVLSKTKDTVTDIKSFAQNAGSNMSDKAEKIIACVSIIALLSFIVLIIVINNRSNAYPDEVLFNGIPLDRYLSMTKSELTNNFGEIENEIDYRYTYAHATVQYLPESDKVLYIKFNPYYCTLNGRKLTGRSKADITKYTDNWARATTGTVTTSTSYFRWGKYNRDGTSYYLDISFITDKVYWIHVFSEDLGVDWDYELDILTIASNEISIITPAPTQIPASQSNAIEVEALTGWLTVRPKYIKDEYEVTGIEPWEGGWEYYVCNDIRFLVDPYMDMIVSVEITNPRMYSYKGTTLDKTRSEIITAFGTPAYDGDATDYTGEIIIGYYMVYELYGGEYNLYLEMEDFNSKVYFVSIDFPSSFWESYYE